VGDETGVLPFTPNLGRISNFLPRHNLSGSENTRTLSVVSDFVRLPQAAFRVNVYKHEGCSRPHHNRSQRMELGLTHRRIIADAGVWSKSASLWSNYHQRSNIIKYSITTKEPVTRTRRIKINLLRTTRCRRKRTILATAGQTTCFAR